MAQSSHRYLALVGCWFAQGDAYLSFHNALQSLKQKHFPHSPDEPPVLHRKDVIGRRGRFWRLRDPALARSFDSALLSLVALSEFVLVGICIDKLALRNQYTRPFDPYGLALGFILERYCGWLAFQKAKGDVMAESRGRKEDQLLEAAYRRIWSSGTSYHAPRFFQQALTSKEVKLKKKHENIAGLQLADILARAVKDDILDEYGLLPNGPAPFDASLIGAIQAKFNRNLKTGKLRGYGKILFPCR